MRLEPRLGAVPECFFRRPVDLIKDALELGYDGVQAIPVRGLTGEESGIELFEGAWNPVSSLWQALRHHDGAGNMPSQLQDWVVSPDPRACSQIVKVMREHGIPQIVHNFLVEPGPDHRCTDLVEVNPSMNMTGQQIAEACKRYKARLVLDTWHLRRDYRPDEISPRNTKGISRPSPLGSCEAEWRRTIDLLAPYVDVVHVNPGDENVEEEMFWLKANTSASLRSQLFRHLLRRLKEAGKDNLTIVAEPRPILRGEGGRRQAEEMLAVLKSIVG